MGTPRAKVYETVGSWFTNRSPLGCIRTAYNHGHKFVCTLQDRTEKDTTSHPIVWVTHGTGTFLSDNRWRHPCSRRRQRSNQRFPYIHFAMTWPSLSKRR